MTEFSHLSIFPLHAYRKTINVLIHDTPVKEEIENSVEHSVVYSILSKKISSKSLFFDNVWDFNDDNLHAARNVKGAKLRLDYSGFVNIPRYVIVEIKCIFFYSYNLQREFSKRASGFKVNTLISHVKSGLRFLNHLFHKCNQIYGEEYVRSEISSISELSESLFKEALLDYPYAVDKDLIRFFDSVRNENLIDIFPNEILIDYPSVFEKHLSKIKPNIAKISDENSVSYLPNDIFEKLLQTASFYIVQFLSSLGELVDDQKSLALSKIIKFDVPVVSLSKKDFDLYVIKRLVGKKYTEGFISKVVHIPDHVYTRNGDLQCYEYILPESNHVREYLNQVYYSSCFVIAQLTGMRPSELAEIKLDSCITEDQGFELLISRVIKNKKNSHLFDDKWVLIPIMKDALRAASLISRLKNNNYLFSNMHTLHPEQAQRPMQSKGVTYQLELFYRNVLAEDEISRVDFNPYVLRHSLAHQPALAG